MKINVKKATDCKAAGAAMPDLLFDPASAPASARAHLAACAACKEEFAEVQSTMLVLENWEVPEPSPFWMARMGARMREEQAQPRRGWAGLLDQIKTRFVLSNYSLKPVAGVAALGLVLAIGGGTWLGVSTQMQTHAVSPSVQASNTVRDLQSLNENAQVFQQLSAIDAPDSNSQNSD